MNIKIEKQRRKTIFLKVIDYENAILKAPKNLSDKKVEEFLASKRGWLEKVASKLRQKQIFKQSYDLTEDVYLFGENLGNLQDLKLASQNSIKRYYQSYFAEIETMAKEISKSIGLAFCELKMHNSMRVWGSFSSTGTMKLNWKLVILPKNLIEYVIIHELCHSKQMNHSPKFWLLVEKFCPNYKHLKTELSNFSFVLKEQF